MIIKYRNAFLAYLIAWYVLRNLNASNANSNITYQLIKISVIVLSDNTKSKILNIVKYAWKDAYNVIHLIAISVIPILCRLMVKTIVISASVITANKFVHNNVYLFFYNINLNAIPYVLCKLIKVVITNALIVLKTVWYAQITYANNVMYYIICLKTHVIIIVHKIIIMTKTEFVMSVNRTLNNNYVNSNYTN